MRYFHGAVIFGSIGSRHVVASYNRLAFNAVDKAVQPA
jgi:hypothetical protein